MGKIVTDAPKNKSTDYLKYEGHDQWWTCDPAGEAILQEAETGMANYKEGVPLMNLVEIFQQAVKKNPSRPALRVEELPPWSKGDKIPPPTPLNTWKTWTWKKYFADSKAVAKAMITLGFEQHDSCNVFGFNSPQWLIGAMGAMMAGGKVAGIYPSDTAEQLQYKSDHSNGSVALVENESCLEKFRQIADNLPYLKAIVSWACEPGEDITTADGRTIRTMTWDEFVKLGQAEDDAAVEARMAALKPSHACALIYTSGTTGNPKAVMISHDNVAYTAVCVLKESGVTGIKAEEERLLSYLPLSHVAGMMVDIIAPLVVTANLAGFKGWFNSNFARPYDLKASTIGDRLTTVRPTIFLGVPRVWEKIMEKLKVVGKQTKGVKKALSSFAKPKAALYTSSRQLGSKPKTPMGTSAALAILGAIKAKLGLDKSKFNFTGAAPMPKEVLEYFGQLGININEVYGMSECTGACTWSTDKYHVWGSVGYEIKGVEVRVLSVEDGKEAPPTESLMNASEEEQGELCYRGRSIMMGYMANERLGEAHVKEIEEKNASAIDATGFLHSGDKGTRDVHGMIKITGRYKELIIGAGGENIAPVPIEDEMKKVCPLISNIMMVGNKRKFNVCLITLKAKGATGELPGGDELIPSLADEFEVATVSGAMSNEAVIQAITDAIKQVNATPEAVPSNAAKIQKFTILPRDFSVQTGEFTATLKLKRQVVDDTFEPIITKMYESDAVYVPYTDAPTPGLDMGN